MSSYCVIGSGISGATIANLLSKKNSVHIYAVSYTHLRAHETPEHLVCRLLLEKKNEISRVSILLFRSSKIVNLPSGSLLVTK